MVTKSKSLQSSPVVTVAILLLFLSLILVSPPVFAHPDEEGEDGHIIPHEIGKLNITGGITSIVQGTNGIANNEDVTDFTYTLDLNFEAAVSSAGKVVVALEAGNGNGVNDNMPSLSISNYDAYVTESGGIVTPSVSQAYFEGNFFDGLLGLHAGKLDVHSLYDENAYANDETDQFVSGIFTRDPGSIFPELGSYYAPGVAFTLNPVNMLEIRLIAANGNGTGFEDIFTQGYGVAHINIKPNLPGKEGNYRFHYIYDARNYTDAGSGKTRNLSGYGISFDQKISDDIGVFVRYSVQDNEDLEVVSWDDKDNDEMEDPEELSYSYPNIVQSAVSGGVSLWGRESDVAGVAYGILTNNEDSPYLDTITNSGNETHLEIYYKFGFSDHFTLTPDLQLVSNTGGDADTDPITVYGVRAQMNF